MVLTRQQAKATSAQDPTTASTESLDAQAKPDDEQPKAPIEPNLAKASIPHQTAMTTATEE